METTSHGNRYERIKRTLATVYLSAVCFGLPLVFHRGYFDITETKQAFFLASGLGYLAASLVLWLLRPQRVGHPARRAWNAAGAARWSMLAFLVCAAVSCAVNGVSGETVIAPHNRYQGLLTVSVYTAVFLCLSRGNANLRAVGAAVTAGASAASLLALLNHFGCDPLGFMTELSDVDRGRFLSTLGNADFFGSYLCLSVPVTVLLFCRAERVRERVGFLAALIAVSLGVLASGSESAVLGLLAAALVFPAMLFGSPRAMKRYLLSIVLFSLTAFLFGLAEARFASATYLSYFMRLYTKPPVALGVALVCGVLLLPLRSAGAEPLLRAKKPYRIVCAAVLAAAAAALILLNTAFRDVSLGSLDRFLKWSDSWGTDRGRIWTYCVELYRSFSPVRKLFGGGPGCLFAADQLQPVFSDAALDSAHNEYLQYLLSFGALGLAAYVCALACSVRAGLRACAREPLVCGFCAAVLACTAQAVVNIAQPVSTPLLFLFLGVLAGCSQGTDEAAPLQDMPVSGKAAR